MNGLIPFRSPHKLKDLHTYMKTPAAKLAQVKSIPKYQYHKRQRKYAYSHVHGFKTYMTDIMFFQPDSSPIWFSLKDRLNARRKTLIPFLIMVHCNSRLALIKAMRDHTAESICDALTTFFEIDKLNENLTIISDSDVTIAKAIELYNQKLATNQTLRRNDDEFVQLNHIRINMSNKENYHTMLALIDRFSRTFRDMIFNAFRANPLLRHEPDAKEVLSGLCAIYNNTPHRTLSEVMGFPVTPVQMCFNPQLQQEFVRRLSGRNYNIPRDGIPVGSSVYVYQPKTSMNKRRNSVEDDKYKVLEQGGRYLLENERTGKKVKHVRSKFFTTLNL